MQVGLAIPCYVDQFRPAAARATLTLLERLGCQVTLVGNAVCCGQPMANVGLIAESATTATRWAEAVSPFAAVVLPSGSCTDHVRRHLAALVPGPIGGHAATATHELCEFIAGPLGRPRLAGRFPHRVAMHLGCHAQRGLRLGGSSELHEANTGPMRGLLSGLEGLSLVALERADECCGFGGSFSVGEPDISVAMGRDRLRDAAARDAEVLVSSDPSCLLHLESIGRASGSGMRTLYIGELLEEATR